MNIFSVMFDKATPEQTQEVRKYVNEIVSSPFVEITLDNEYLTVYRYTDYLFSVIKTVLRYPDGTLDIKTGIVLNDNTQVYDGIRAIKLYKWFDHLKDVYEDVRLNTETEYHR